MLSERIAEISSYRIDNARKKPIVRKVLNWTVAGGISEEATKHMGNLVKPATEHGE